MSMSPCPAPANLVPVLEPSPAIARFIARWRRDCEAPLLVRGRVAAPAGFSENSNQ